MNWSNEVKAQFTVFVLSGDMDQCASIKAAISREGFEAFLFPDQETLMTRLQELAPHLIVFSKTGVSSRLVDFIQSIIDINSEIQFLPVSSAQDIKEFISFRGYNFVGVCPDGEGFLSRLVWMVDECLQKTYLTYQNEQIFIELQKLQAETDHIQQKIEASQAQVEHSSGLKLKSELEKFQFADSKEEVLKIFLREMSQKFLAKNKRLSIIYFKYLPTVQSFVVVQSMGIPLEKVEGIGIKLSEPEMKDPVGMFRDESIPAELMKLMSEGLAISDYIFKPVFIQDLIDGFFVFWIENGNLAELEIENDLTLFHMIYERGHLMKKVTSMEISDNVTELHNRFFYLKNLTDEVSRARRLQKAVSVIKLKIDHLPELEQMFGRGGKDQILRTISSMIRKTSRVNDVSCRTGDNEISLILPHSARKGATLRAERIRRMVEVQSFHNLGQRVTVSCGVSEYPSLCSSSEELEKTSLEALEYISAKDGNKVCLYKPHDSFVPDFNVPPL